MTMSDDRDGLYPGCRAALSTGGYRQVRVLVLADDIAVVTPTSDVNALQPSLFVVSRYRLIKEDA